MSADLVGSTAYKATKSSELVPEWASTFREFFRGFPNFVTQQYVKVVEDGRSPKFITCQNQFTPWKFLGDEILFHVELKDHTEVPSHLWVFQQAITHFPNDWAQKKVPLRLKGSAWLAGFPVTNCEIVIPSVSGETLDFIGPSLDLGFRLSKFADERRFILSADLALMLLDAVHRRKIDSQLFKIFLHGKEHLKGVIDNRPYPVVWLDFGDDEKDLEERLLGTARKSEHSAMIDYLNKFIDKNSPALFRPFIQGDSDSNYSTISPAFCGLREKMQGEDSGRGFETDSARGEPEPEGLPKLPKPPDAPKKRPKKTTPR